MQSDRASRQIGLKSRKLALQYQTAVANGGPLRWQSARRPIVIFFFGNLIGDSLMSFDSSSYPYDTVVHITDMIGGQSWQGSGVLISPDEVLTASHVVYNSTYGTASDIQVAPAYNYGAEPFGVTIGTYIHYFTIQDTTGLITNQQSQFDYAVIHLAQPFSNLGTMGLESNFQGGYVNVTGYPAVLNGAMENSSQYVTVDPAYSLLDGTAIGEGSSGGPVWISGSGGGPYVVGLVSTAAGGIGSTGYFTQITTSVFNQIEAWVAQDDAPPPPPRQVVDPNNLALSGDVTGAHNFIDTLNFVASYGRSDRPSAYLSSSRTRIGTTSRSRSNSASRPSTAWITSPATAT